MPKFIVPALGLVAMLAACQQGSDLDRAVVGGITGCVAGEIIKDGECVTGAAIGAAGGALANDI